MSVFILSTDEIILISNSLFIPLLYLSPPFFIRKGIRGGMYCFNLSTDNELPRFPFIILSIA
jgi:hypothetical protein